jgi:hypothetical protein
MKLEIIWRKRSRRDDKPMPTEVKITPMNAKFQEYPNFSS